MFRQVESRVKEGVQKDVENKKPRKEKQGKKDHK